MRELSERLKRPLRFPLRRLRLATGPIRILPSFLIIGAQRAGTTTLFDQLLRHPDVRGPLASGSNIAWARKELHFFDERFWQGPNWYRSFFPTVAARRAARLRGGDVVAGEATPYYLFHPLVPERVAATIPDVRLVAVLRNPVDRAYSHYQMMRRTGREPLSFEDALAAEEERLAGEEERILTDPRFRGRHHRHHAYVARGLYADQLERWLAHFPRDRLLVLSAEEFFRRPEGAYAEVIDFLGVRRLELASLGHRASTASPGRPWSRREKRNVASYDPMDAATRARLEERFAEPNARLARLVDRDFDWIPAAPPPRGDAIRETAPGHGGRTS